MKKNRSSTFALLLVIIFLVVVMGGRYFFGAPVTKMLPPVSSPGQASTSLQTKSAQNVENTQQATNTDSIALSCGETLRAEVISKKESYAKGQILVTFKKDQSYGDSKNILAVYGLVIQNENNSQASFSARHLVTAAVAPGQEITKVCLLHNDTHVAYAGLDLYFGLHE